MNAEAPGPINAVQAEATHFTAEKKPVVIDKNAEATKAANERKGLLGGLRKLLSREGGEKPEAPKKALEMIEVMEMADMVKSSGDSLAQIIHEEVPRMYAKNDYYDSSGAVNVGEINRRRTERNGENTPPLADTPPPLAGLITRINHAMGQPDKGTTITKLRIFPGSVDVVTETGIQIVVHLPRETNHPAIKPHDSVTLQIFRSATMTQEEVPPELNQEFGAIQHELQTTENLLLDISEATVKHVKDIVDKLPEENAIRRPERAAEEAAEKARRDAEDKAYQERIDEDRRQREALRQKERLQQMQALAEKRKLTPEQEAEVAELKARHPDNPLFKQPWQAEELAKNGLTEVFIYVSEDALDTIGENGVTPIRTDEMKADDAFIDSSTRRRFDFQRGTSVFAHPDITQVDMKMSKGTVVLSTLVNPDQTYVFDASYYTDAVTSKNPDFARGYWDSAISLSSYLRLSPSERQQRIMLPEVLVQNATPENTRVDHVDMHTNESKSAFYQSSQTEDDSEE